MLLSLEVDACTWTELAPVYSKVCTNQSSVKCYKVYESTGVILRCTCVHVDLCLPACMYNAKCVTLLIIIVIL